MKLITSSEHERLRENGRVYAGHYVDALELVPVLHLMTPDGKRSWMLIAVDPKDHDRVLTVYARYGLGARLVWRSISRISRIKDRFGCGTVKDPNFDPVFSAAIYCQLQDIEFGTEE